MRTGTQPIADQGLISRPGTWIPAPLPADRSGTAVVAGPDKAVLVRVDHGLDPVPQAELGQDAAHVRLDRGLGHEQLLGELGVGQALGHQDQHLAFAFRQFTEVRRAGRRSGRVVEGATTASPECTALIANSSSSGGTSLSRKPLAPAFSAANAYSSRSKVVSMSTLGRSPACRIWRVA